ncbi:MAG TPA: Ig-like domain-containing protein [Gemmatales bacterium]|nr:Ig-like domain-containing protein [Gemmatales bacterium]
MFFRALRPWLGMTKAKPSQRAKSFPKRPRGLLILETLEDRCVPAIFTVINTNDSGVGSLRQAMLDAEAAPNVGGVPDEIHFNIPGNGVHTIFPGPGVQSPLPTITEAVIIDGYTQSGASPNTLAVGDDAVLTIEINGSNMSAGAQLFIINGSNGSTIRGLAITHVPFRSFSLGYFGQQANNNTISGNFIGTDAEGTTFQAEPLDAIGITTGSNNVIGGTAPADRNVITSGRTMIDIGQGTGNVIQGNYIGVNKDGTAPLQPSAGTNAISINGQFSGGNTIGGVTPDAGNVILGTLTGIIVGIFNGGTMPPNVVQGNFIGTNATGTAGLGGGDGINIQSSSDTITDNLISGNSTGIFINHQGPPGPGPTIRGNKIGTDVNGTVAIPNSSDGIFLLSSPGGVTIGGTGLGDGNTIAFNGGFGIRVNVGTGCSILGNSTFANGRLGITLNGDVNPLPNDPGDGDNGANGFQNFPELTNAVGGSSTTVTGTLNSTPNTTFRLEFFANDTADPSGFGEAETFLGFTIVTTDGNGDVSFTATQLLGTDVGQIISATATNPTNSTSEFSANVVVTTVNGNTPPVITSFAGPGILLVGQIGFFGGSFTDPDNDIWTATVNFGDGTGDRPMDTFSDKTFGNLKAFASPGTYTVTVTIADNHGGSDTRSLVVTINSPTNSPPLAQNDTALLNTTPSRTINVLANDSDPDGDHLTVTAVTQPASGHGIVTINANGTLTYRQTVYVNGTESFSYTISDGQGGRATSTVTVTVNLPASVGIQMLIDQVRDSSLSQPRKNSLVPKLSATQDALAHHHPVTAAIHLVTFGLQVRRFERDHILTTTVADLWLFELRNLLTNLF